MSHAQLRGAIAEAWSAPIGQGNGRRHRITADPVVSGGVIYTLDSRALLVATRIDGTRAWARDLTPAGEGEDDGSGGGIMVVGDRVFATSGFGSVSAIDASDGSVIWQQRLGAPVVGAPWASDGLVYAVSRNNIGWALEAGTGRIVWSVTGSVSATGRTGASGPISTGRTAIFPFSSGELAAVFRKSGLPLWRGYAVGADPGQGLAKFTDITGAPVVSGNRLIAGNSSGVTAAISLQDGTEIWAAPFGAMSRVWLAGGSVFLVSDDNTVVRLNADTGQLVWSTQLGLFERDRAPKRQRDIFAHYGPVLAGGRLLVASDDAVLRQFDAQTGAALDDIALPAGAATNPVVAGGVLYLVTEDGTLRAFR